MTEMKIMRPPVVPMVGWEGGCKAEGLDSADFRRCGSTALRVLKEPSRSISTTDLNALGESAEIGARKFPAAPILRNGSQGFQLPVFDWTYMQ